MDTGEAPATETLHVVLLASSVVVWDFDGVIANTEPIQEDAYRLILRDEGIRPTRGFFRSLVGRSEPEIWGCLCDEYKFHAPIEDLMRRRRKHYLREAVQHLRPREFVVPALTALEEAGIQSVIVSAGSFENITTLLNEWKLAERYSEVYCRDSSAGMGYPTKLEKLRHVAGIYGPIPSVLEDSRDVLNSARAIGFRTIGVRHELNSVSKSDCDLLLDTGRSA